MKLYITNTFALAMLNRDVQRGAPHRVRTIARVPRPVDNPREFVIVYRDIGAEFAFAVGNPSSATLFTEALGVSVPVSHATVRLEQDDQLLVGQYVGPRLSKGASIEWWVL
jgi:hypothetical protein